jgi:SAM-dependent methyltransferase
MTVVWHDLECGGYTEDLSLWLQLASRHPGPILDVGAGTGRTAVVLARAGHRVTGLDNDPELVDELRRRAAGLELDAVLADAREFELERRFGLVIVPMQTIQLLGGSGARARFLARARAHLLDGAVVALALSDELDLFDVHDDAAYPLPDVCERDGVVYSSRPTAVRDDGDAFVLERRREVVTPAGDLDAELNVIRLDRLDAAQLEQEAAGAGLRPAGRTAIPPTQEYVGSVVVMLEGTD